MLIKNEFALNKKKIFMEKWISIRLKLSIINQSISKYNETKN